MATNKFLSLKQLFYLSICVFGIQFTSSLQMANTSSVYKFLGASSNALPLLWLAAPISGLLIQPIIGQVSDDTFSKFGKRHPYILAWGIISCICLCILPFVNTIWAAALLLWLIGCSINGCTEAVRALTGDIVPNQQKTTAFSWQTIFSGIGAGLAALLPWFLEKTLKMPKDAIDFSGVPASIQLAFIIGGVILIAAVLCTLLLIKEKIPTHKELLIKSRQLHKRTFLQRILLLAKDIYKNIKRTPTVIRVFIPAQICTWVAIFTIWLYFSVAIAQNVYGLPAGAIIVGNADYEAIMARSALQTGFYFGVYQFVSVLYALILPVLTEKFSPKLIHGISLAIGACSLISIGFLHSEQLLNISMVGIGIMWGSVCSLPYAIVAAEVPRSKMGVYLGIFNITITIPQIIVGFLLGPINTYLFRDHTIYTIILAGLLMLLGAYFMINQVIPIQIPFKRLLKRQWQT